MKLDLSLATNAFGKLAEPTTRRIEEYCLDPSTENWHSIHGIMLHGESMTTVWKAVAAVDPTFPRRGRLVGPDGQILEDWEKIPSYETICQAVAYATH